MNLRIILRMTQLRVFSQKGRLPELAILALFDEILHLSFFNN